MPLRARRVLHSGRPQRRPLVGLTCGARLVGAHEIETVSCTRTGPEASVSEVPRGEPATGAKSPPWYPCRGGSHDEHTGGSTDIGNQVQKRFGDWWLMKKGCMIGLAPMRFVVAALSLVPSAAPTTVACRVLVLSRSILSHPGGARSSEPHEPTCLHEPTRLHQTRYQRRPGGRARVHLLGVGNQLRVSQRRPDAAACGGRRHR